MMAVHLRLLILILDCILLGIVVFFFPGGVQEPFQGHDLEGRESGV